MADALTSVGVNVRDAGPIRGLIVSVQVGGDVVWLEPADAARLAERIEQAAADAIHASRSSRREANTCRAPHWGYAFKCSRPEGHDGDHENGGVAW